AYWRGDSKKKMLQRIYGIAFPKAAEKALANAPTYALRGEVLVDALPRLAALTGMAWELVAEDGKGGYVKEEASRFIKNDSKLHLRTVEPVADMAKARTALAAFLGEAKPSHAGQLSRAGQVSIPAGSIRPAHLRRMRPGLLAEAFAPAPKMEFVAPGTRPVDDGPPQR
ncbi:MAG: hypothetical protein K2Q01_03935, partial [Rickettsiales bacterium]|nr:hypothetical protein [Rickettsiales bacterium]